MKHLPPQAPDKALKSLRIFLKLPVLMTPGVTLPPVPLVSLLLAVNLPPVLTIPMANMK
jgi:hypothetical protein